MMVIDTDKLEEIADHFIRYTSRLEEICLRLRSLHTEMLEEPLFTSISQSETVIEIVSAVSQTSAREFETMQSISKVVSSMPNAYGDLEKRNRNALVHLDLQYNDMPR